MPAAPSKGRDCRADGCRQGRKHSAKLLFDAHRDVGNISDLYGGKKMFPRKRAVYYCQNRNPYKRAYVYHVSGCCFAMSAACAKAVTPLDEGTMLYGEELILGLTMERCGYRTIYEPQSVVMHWHGATAGRLAPLMYQCISQSELYYCGKYLKAARWQLWVLYQYRRCLYLLRCMKSRELARSRSTFLAETKKSYQQARNDRKQKNRT